MSGIGRYLVAGSWCLAMACGGGGNTGPSGGGAGTMSASIDGAAWVAEAQFLQPITQQQKQGHIPLYGAKFLSTTSSQGIQLNLVGIPGPGTYPLGTSGGVSGGIASVFEGTSIWQTPLSGAAGSVTVSVLTPTRAAGTFQFTAAGISASGTRTVTNGKFDFPIQAPANLPPMAQSDTGSMTATLGGSPWFGASGGGGAPSAGTLLAIFINESSTIAVQVAPYTGPGTYTIGGSTANLGNAIRVTQGTKAGLPCCWGGKTQLVGGQVVSLDAGTITITSASASRIRGTFSGTLAPGLTGTATTSLVITNGSFSYGFP
ncbi:MAG: hypothetical protein KJZ47_06620 [Gemmatimonadales bacterium]|nr:hypothetical protein [Gemmatimonadales bacterium]